MAISADVDVDGRQDQDTIQPLLVTSAAPAADSISVELGSEGAANSSTTAEADLDIDELLHCSNVKSESKLLLQSALPIIMSTTTQLLIMLPMMSAVGGLGTAALASMNLVSIYAGLCGIAPLSGMAMALDSLCSQAFTAAKDKRMLGLYLQRVFVLIVGIEAVIYPLWWNAQPIFKHIGVPDEIARIAGQMLRLYFFGVGALLVYECLKSYLFAQGIRRAAVIGQACCLPLIWLSIWLLISNDATSLGILGVPSVIIVAGLCFGIFSFVFIARVDGYQCWGGWSRAAFSGLWPVFKLGIAGSTITFFEMISLHMIDLGVLFLDAPTMAAQAILAVLLSGTSYFGTGFAIAACNRVGNMLGSQLPNRALLTVYVTLSIAFSTFAVLCGVVVANCEAIAGLFSDDAKVVAILSAHIPWAAVGGTVQGASMALSGILRGQGRQSLIARIRIASFAGIALPLSVVAVVGFKWQLAGLWFGYVSGAAVSMCGQIYAVLTTDWNNEVELCQHRILHVNTITLE
ncbi:hypothetical protein LPJ68_003580 [Coemansia sp. RSA 1086]|nr:hypothetical protein LPJ68_003580 [Coemansia sp. RSA 1086]